MPRLLLLCLLALAGCAASVPPAGTQFDGPYAGQSTLTDGFGYVCSLPSYPLSISIHDGRFDYPVLIGAWGAGPIPVQVHQDGSLTGKLLYPTEDYSRVQGRNYISAWATIEGHISGTTLNATVSDYRCARQLALQRGAMPG